MTDDIDTGEPNDTAYEEIGGTPASVFVEQELARAINGLAAVIEQLVIVGNAALAAGQQQAASVPAQNAPQAVAAAPVAQVPPPANLGPQQGVSWGGSQPQPLNTAWLCPTHGQAKVVPAGVSKKTQRPYDAFVACPVSGCNEKPPRQ